MKSIFKPCIFAKRTNNRTSSRLHLMVATLFVVQSSLMLWPQAFAAQQGLSIGTSAANFSYQEPGLMSIKGPMFGAEAQYLLVTESSLSWRSKSSLHYGRIQYDGSLFTPRRNLNVPEVRRPVQYPSEDFLLHLQSDLGYQLNIDSQSHWRFFAGLQYRQWFNELIGAGGYRRWTTAATLPMGVEFQHRYERWTFSWEGQIQFWLWGENKSFLSDARRDFADTVFRQRSGRALSFSFETSRNWGGMHPFIRLQADLWRVGESDTSVVGDGFVFLEPRNETDFYQLIVGLHF